MRRSGDPDLVVLGEVLVELAADRPFASGGTVRLGVSGDAVNAAAAGAAAGARTALLTRIADDELGTMIMRRLDELGIDTSLVSRVPGQQAAYFVHGDPGGRREFVYLREGSAGSGLAPADVVDAGVQRAAAVLATGVTAAISDSARAAVLEAARRSTRFIYDPNHRPRLSDAGRATEVLVELAPHAALVTPACPGETVALLGTADPSTAALHLREMGADAVVVTSGAHQILVADDSGSTELPAVPAPSLVDQTGAGDCLAGTVAARLALGDDLVEAVRLGAAAASLSLGGLGGTGRVPSLGQMRAHLARHRTAHVGTGVVGDD